MPAPAAPPAASIVSGNAPIIDRTSRLLVQPLDSLGSAPELLSHPEESDLSPLRGHSFVLHVDASGHVRSAEEVAAKQKSREETARRDADVARDKKLALLPLERLQFKPGDRPRQLLVRIE